MAKGMLNEGKGKMPYSNKGEAVGARSKKSKSTVNVNKGKKKPQYL